MDSLGNIFLSPDAITAFNHHSALQVVILIIIGFLSGMVIAWLYKYTFQGIGYTLSFPFALVFLTAISTLVIVAIGESVARAFALAGALSIIRFRTPVKDVRDITFVFLSLIIGLSLGTGKVLIGVSALLVISILILGYNRFQKFAYQGQRAIIRIDLINSDAINEELPKVFRRYTRSFKILDLVHTENAKQARATYIVQLRKDSLNGLGALVDTLNSLDNVGNCNAQMQFDAIEI